MKKGDWMRKLFLYTTTLFCFGLFAQSSLASGFVKTAYEPLEKMVQAKHEASFIAKKLSQTKSFEEWPSDLDTNLKLYVAINWYNKSNFLPAFNLLGKTDPVKSDESLWTYYRAMCLLQLDMAADAKRMITKLELEHPGDQDTIIVQTTYLAHTNRLILAVGMIDDYLRKDKKNGYIYFHRGYIHMLSLSHTLAIEDFKLAIRHLPKNDIRKRQQAFLQSGMIQLKYFLDSKKASALFKKGKALDPNSDLIEQLDQAIR